MKKILPLFFLLSVSGSLAFADGYLDSLYKEYHIAKVDTVRYNIANEILAQRLNAASEYYNPDSAVEWLESSLSEIRSKNDPERLAIFLSFKSLYYHDKNEYELSNSYLDSSIQLTEPFHNYQELASLHFSKFSNFSRLNLQQHCVESIYKAISYNEKACDKNGLANSFFYLGNLYRNSLQYTKAEECYLKSAAIFGDSDSVPAGMCYQSCARIALRQNDLKKAKEYLDKALPVLSSNVAFQPFYYYQTYGQWLKATGKNEEAIQYFTKASIQCVKGNQRYQKPVALCQIAEIYIEENKPGKAKKLLDEAIVIAAEENNSNTNYILHQTLSKYYEASNMSVKAFEEFKIAQLLKDSSNQNELTQSLTGSALEFDYNKKEIAQAEEQRKKDEIEAHKLKQQKLIAYSTGSILMFVGIISFLLFRNNRQQKKANAIITAEKQRSESLLLNILPSETAEELKATGSAEAKNFDAVTVMFTDFKNFTQTTEKMTGKELVSEINCCFSEFDKIISKYGIEKIKTIGDSYMCAGGLPVTSKTHAEDVVGAALEVRDFILKHKKEKESKGEIPFEIRIGVHTGPVVAGIVGIKKFAYDIWGDTVNTASRMENSGESGMVNISETTYELVKDKFTCAYRGKVKAKNKGEVDMYFVESISSSDLAAQKI